VFNPKRNTNFKTGFGDESDAYTTEMVTSAVTQTRGNFIESVNFNKTQNVNNIPSNFKRQINDPSILNLANTNNISNQSENNHNLEIMSDGTKIPMSIENNLNPDEMQN
jgi:hypothetical protein